MQDIQGSKIQWPTSEAVPTALGRMRVRWNLGFWTLTRSGYALAALLRHDRQNFSSSLASVTAHSGLRWKMGFESRFAPLDNFLEHATTLRIDRVRGPNSGATGLDQETRRN